MAIPGNGTKRGRTPSAAAIFVIHSRYVRLSPPRMYRPPGGRAPSPTRCRPRRPRRARCRRRRARRALAARRGPCARCRFPDTRRRTVPQRSRIRDYGVDTAGGALAHDGLGAMLRDVVVELRPVQVEDEVLVRRRLVLRDADRGDRADVDEAVHACAEARIDHIARARDIDLVRPGRAALPVTPAAAWITTSCPRVARRTLGASPTSPIA